MNQIKLIPIAHDLVATFGQEKVVLPSSVRLKIDEYWRELIAKNPRLHNGEVFTVDSVKGSGSDLAIRLSETDYAHYLYSMRVGGLGEYAVHIIHPAALVISADNKLIFGSMATHTSQPKVIQCCGGGIDHSDIRDGIVDMEHAIAKELNEELGIDPYDESRVEKFYPAYLKTGGATGKMTVSYIVRTRETSTEFMRSYEAFTVALRRRSETAEFEELFCIDNNQSSVDVFISKHATRLNEYMDILLRTVAAESN